jgi:hypothetical protein
VACKLVPRPPAAARSTVRTLRAASATARSQRANQDGVARILRCCCVIGFARRGLLLLLYCWPQLRLPPQSRMQQSNHCCVLGTTARVGRSIDQTGLHGGVLVSVVTLIRRRWYCTPGKGRERRHKKNWFFHFLPCRLAGRSSTARRARGLETREAGFPPAPIQSIDASEDGKGSRKGNVRRGPQPSLPPFSACERRKKRRDERRGRHIIMRAVRRRVTGRFRYVSLPARVGNGAGPTKTLLRR